ncbi:MAG: (d)CMP kinase [Thermodesulfovibrionales bacterium]|nr:(d)CMP kinase [Thermodesulfovibrionales bacterium]
MKRVIAIDGPSGAGKSTIAKMLAQRLNFRFLDTGALYRAVALYLKSSGLNEDSPDKEILSHLKMIKIFFENEDICIAYDSCNGGILDYSLCISVTEEIRSPEIGHYASIFSARQPVRDFLFSIQREVAFYDDVVAEGRDMTTVVFPDAWKKFYLDASETERAKRRYLQLKAKNLNITFQEALDDIRKRDERDLNRPIAPLRIAEDAIYIDTTNKGPEEVIEFIIDALKPGS